jgi:hypothetical protein
MQPGSIIGGWTGTARTVTIRVRNGNRNGDRLDVTGATLGLVRLSSRDWVTGTVNFTGTLTFIAPNTIRLVIGACTSGCGNVGTTLVGSTTFAWTPDNGAEDLATNNMSTATVSEIGGPRPNF